MADIENKNQKLEMSFDPQTIEHLGVKMYSQLPNAIAELIANSYDAESPEVHSQPLKSLHTRACEAI